MLNFAVFWGDILYWDFPQDVAQVNNELSQKVHHELSHDFPK